MNHEEMERCFPKLTQRGYAITSPFDENYNCIAFAAEDETRWWWPDDSGEAYWPPEARRTETIEAFILAFAVLGYERCAERSLEPGFQKIALYADARGVPTHACRQTSSGAWLSKLGKCQDIQHEAVGSLEESVYGTIAVFMKRPLRPTR